MSVPFELIPLGVGAAVPTRTRHLSATAVHRSGRILLFDCGEGTQFQLLHADLSASRVEAIFITHLHGDHYFGLAGLLTTLDLIGRKASLEIVGPVGLRRFLSAAPGTRTNDLRFDVTIQELEAGRRGTVFSNAGVRVETVPLDHSVPCHGYRVEEVERLGALDVEKVRRMGVADGPDFGRLKAGEDVWLPSGDVVRSADVVGPPLPGRSVAYLLDTLPCDGGRELAAGTDLVVHDATFLDERRDRARETFHATAAQAAEVARDAGAGRLLLSHFSARYDDLSPLVAEAREIFPNTDAAEELRRYAIE